ncbi:MAG: hypothetical protein GQ546_03660, partial [Gammaproteobacteria bacterium]|nr:hypothetical protein [Gammaproteobacteria bacterium]
MTRITKNSMLRCSALKHSIAVLLLAITSISNSLYAESESDYKNRPLDIRVDRLERLMSSQKQLELLYRMKQLQQENQQLRGLLEEQSNELHILKQQQRELYSDLNRRLGQMEGSSTTTSDAPKLSDQTIDQIPAPKIVDLPVVLDKSTVGEAKYGVTQREEIVVIEEKTKPKPQVATIKPMSAKERQAEQKMYQQAYDELRARRYNKARDS